MADNGWKQFERRASRDMGVERQPVTGARHGADNAPHPLFCFQFKLRRMLPAWLFAWLGGIVATAARDGKIGVLVLKTPRLEDREALVVVRWRDWVDLHGPVPFGIGPHRTMARPSTRGPTSAPHDVQPRHEADGSSEPEPCGS